MAIMIFFPDIKSGLVEFVGRDDGYDEFGEWATSFEKDDVATCTGRAMTTDVENVLMLEVTIEGDEPAYWIEAYVKEESSYPAVIPSKGPKRELLTQSTQCSLLTEPTISLF